MSFCVQSPSLYARKSKGIFYGIFLKSRLYVLPGMTYREQHLPFLENSCSYLGQCQGNTFQNTRTRKICTSQRYLKLMQSVVTSGSAALIGLSKSQVEIWAHALWMFRIHLPPSRDIQQSILGCLTSPRPSPSVPRKSVACSFKTVIHKCIFFSGCDIITLCYLTCHIYNIQRSIKQYNQYSLYNQYRLCQVFSQRSKSVSHYYQHCCMLPIALTSH